MELKKMLAGYRAGLGLKVKVFCSPVVRKHAAPMAMNRWVAGVYAYGRVAADSAAAHDKPGGVVVLVPWLVPVLPPLRRLVCN